jgi:fibronectin type 3 domain-containing protein
VVTAVNAAGESGNSNQASATPQLVPPSPPTTLVATAGVARVILNWSASSGASSYNVKRSTTSGGPYNTIASPTITSYTDSGLTIGTTYFYVVTAVNAAGESGNSNQASATPTSLTGANAFVQSTNYVNFGSTPTFSQAFPSNNTAGNLIIVSFSWDNSGGQSLSTIGDSQGNSYTSAVGSGNNSIYYAKNIHSGPNTVTVTFSAPTGGLMYLHEYAGLDTVAPLDQVSSQTGTGTTITSGAKTTTKANELIFGYASVAHRVSAAGSGFTVRETAAGNMSEDMVVSSTGSYGATFTQSISGGWTGLMATFIAAGSK